MDELRIKRYKDKVNYIIDNIKDLPIEPKNELEKRGIFYSLQTSIESIVDLIAMLVKDIGIQVKDDTTNISEIAKKRNLDSELGEKLKRANGLRNILVHRYNEIDEKIILNSVEKVKNVLLKWLDIVEVVLNDYPKMDELADIFTPIKDKYEIILFGSIVEGGFRAESDIDIGVISRNRNQNYNIELQKKLLGQFPVKFNVRVFELFPIDIQISVILNYEVLFGDPLEISEYFYEFRKKWDDCKHRILSNQFSSYHERLSLSK